MNEEWKEVSGEVEHTSIENELRDWFAGMSIQGYANDYMASDPGHTNVIAKGAYKLADAMLKERENEN